MKNENCKICKKILNGEIEILYENIVMCIECAEKKLDIEIINYKEKGTIEVKKRKKDDYK